MGFYRTTSYAIEAIQYDGSNISEIREILSRQEPSGRLMVTGLNVPYLRQPNRPDQPLLRGDWILLDPSHWAYHMSDDFFSRSYQ